MNLVDKALMATALGEEKADRVITGGKLVNVMTEEIYPADVAIKGQRIAYVGDVNHCTGPETEIVEVEGKYLVPGLIEPHIHPEACKITLTRLAEALLPRGTTTIFAGMDETWAVTGIDGVRFALDEAKQTPLRVFYHPYARVPVTGTEPSSTAAYPFGAEAIRKVTAWPETVGTMDTVIDWVLGFDEEVMGEMEHLQSRGYLVHGHDTFEMGPRMQAFLTTGIRSDHVPFSAEEALEKLRSGMWVMFSDGPITHVMPEVVRAITESKISARHAAFCIDDMETRDAFEMGHMDHQVRSAIGAGLDPIRAVQMASLNAAELHRMDHLIGSIAPGKYADLLLVGSLSQFKVEKVFASGRLVAEDGQMLMPLSSPQYPDYFFNTFHLARRVAPDDLVLKVDGQASQARVLVLYVPPYSPVRVHSEATLPVVDGKIQSDPASDVLYCAVVERHKQTGNIGLGFVSGFGLHGGTMATTLGSPTCNIMCLGSNPQDMALAINYLAEIGGGQVLVKDGQVVEEIRLPLGGFMADVPPQEMAEKERAITGTLNAWGCPIERPWLYFMFFEIVPLPEYALTEHGVVEFKSLQYVDPVLEVIP